MGIIEKNGFKFHDGLSSDCIVVEDQRLEEYIDYINSEKIKDATANMFYYQRNDLNFLDKCPNIEKFSVAHKFINDFNGLYSLNKLKILYAETPQGDLDLSKFSDLKVLSIGFGKHVLNLDSCKNLIKLYLWKYNPKSYNLEEISDFAKLQELELTQSNIESLKGCERLKLKKLQFNYLRKLEILNNLEGCSDALENLIFESCKNIRNHDYLSTLKILKSLVFVRCGEINTIQFIKELPQLKRFVCLETNIVDGDTSPCIGIDYVSFTNKSHYSHKMSFFKTNQKQSQ